MRPSTPCNRAAWRHLRAAIASGATLTGSAGLLWRKRAACETPEADEDSQSSSSFGSKLNSIKDSLTPTSALEFQQRLDHWNKSFEDLVLLTQRLYSELSFADDSLARHIVDNDRVDVQLHPELEWDARVRLSDQPCFQERAYFRQRQRRIRAAYARLLDVPEDEIDTRDLPIFGVFSLVGESVSQSLIKIRRRGCFRRFVDLELRPGSWTDQILLNQVDIGLLSTLRELSMLCSLPAYLTLQPILLASLAPAGLCQLSTACQTATLLFSGSM